MELRQAIEQRKTIKSFDKNVKISRAELEEMLTLAQLAPSKANLQPWRFVVVDSKTIKGKLSQHVSFNTQPCETASVVIAVLADLQYQNLLGDILDQAVSETGMAEEVRADKFDFLLNLHNQATKEQIRDQVITDTSLAAMQLMLVAKDRGFDTHAIGIFDRPAVMEILKVNTERYLPVMLLAVGKATQPAITTCRLPLEYTVSWNSGKDFKK